MAKQKIDGVIEAVHYSPEGQVSWVRVYERRGAAFSDLCLVSRQDLIERLKKGMRFLTGSRKIYLAGSFELSLPLRLVQANGKDFLTITEERPNRDSLDELPVV